MVESPLHNRQESVAALLAFFKDHFFQQEKSTDTAPSMEEAHASLWPESHFDHQALRYVMTDLTKIVEEYLVQLQLEKDPGLRTRLILAAYLERKQDKAFASSLKRSLAKLEANSLRDAGYHFQKFRLEEAGLHHDRIRQNRSGEDWIYPLLQELKHFSLATRLQYTCELLNRSMVLRGNIDPALLDEVQQEAKSLGAGAPPAILLYRAILHTLIEPEQRRHYDELRKLLRGNAEQFGATELGQLYAFALNYCIRRLNAGEAAYLRELFTLYQELIERRLLHEEGQLPPQHFKNIVTVGLRLREFEWTEQFIETLHHDIAASERQNAYLYNLASLKFAQGNYGSARKLLQKVYFSDIFYALDSKSMLLKSYYELEEWEPLLSLLESFRRLLDRNKTISNVQRKLYRQLLRYVRKMVSIKLGGKASAKALLREIETAKDIADIGWLLEKFAELAAAERNA